MQKATLIILVFGLSFMSLVQPKFSKSMGKFYKFIPGGAVLLNNDTISVNSFYMFSHEISNFNWLEFQNDLRGTGRIQDLEISRVHCENWNSKGNSNAKMAELYHKHPSYKDYPVVNVSHEAAQLYCVWLTSKLNALPKPLGVNVNVRLPLHAELIRAGVGDKLGEWYPWCHPYMQSSKGEFLANFARVLNSQVTWENGQAKILPTTEVSSSLSTDLLAPSMSFWPSASGIYNLCGNAAEMTNIPGIAVGGSWRDYGHDIRLQSTKKYEGASVDLGFRVVVTWGEN